MFYYAEIDNDYLVINTYSLTESSTNGNYISITEEQYTNGNLIGKYYNSLVGAFEIIDMMNYMGNSDFVTHYDTQMPLSTKIDNMQFEINSKADINHIHSGYASFDDLELLTDVINTKANATHTHTEYAPLSHTHDEYATIDHTHNNYSLTTHTHTASEVGAAASVHNHDEDYSPIDHSHSGYATVASLNEVSATVVNKASAEALNSHADDTELHITEAERNSWNAKSDFSGNYNDLTNRPSIPSIDGLATEDYVNTQINAIDIPSALSELTADSTHRTVTDAEKTTWNAKSNFSGSYNDLTDKPSIPSISGLATETYVDEAVSSKANSSHSHDDRYYTETEINTKLANKADSSHNHAGVYDVNGAAASALTSANAYTDTKINALVGEGASTTLDTIGEISSAIEENQDAIDLLNAAIGTKANASDLTSHTGNVSNPHSVTKSQVGLGNVPNVATNDQTPTYSDATTLATLASGEKLSVAFGKIKLAITNLINHIANKSNPHNVTKSQVGLGNVDNTSDANKPISTAMQTALDGKASSSHTHSAATTSAAGFMSASDKSKLDGITASADSVSFSRSLTSGTKVGTITINGTGTDLYAPTNTDTHYVSGTVVGSSTSATSNTTSSLTNGNVYLNHVENGSVKNSHKISGSGATTVASDASGNIVVSSTNTTYGVATSSGLGLVKSGTDITVDSSGNVSVNDDSHNHVISNIDNLQSSLDAKQATVTGGASTITSSNLTANRALVSNSSGKVAVSAVTSTELGYLDGVTSNVQTQLDGKAASSHNHSASNITSGTLSSDRLPTVPIAKGGTGATTAAAALTNLGITATATELNYVDGVTSNIQTQLNGKSSTSHTHSYAGSSSVGGAATSANKLNTNAGDSNTPVYFSNGVPVACTSLDLNTTGSAASCTGNSATATKLATARTITLSNDLQGSASFDGSGNINIVASNYQASIASSNTNTYPYHRIAYINNITGQWNDKDAIFEIRHTFNGGGHGRFKASYRTNSTGTTVSASVTWLYRYNIASDAITIGTYGVTGDACYADIFYKISSTYARAEVIQVIGDRAWTLVASTETANAASHTECWASISDAATALHSQTYTNTYTSVDGGTVNNANVATKLGSSTVGGTAKPIYLNGGTATACSSTVGGTAKPVYMNAGTITACSSTVGSATQPVYMNGGTITACTYTLGKSVPSNAVFTDTTYSAAGSSLGLVKSGGDVTISSGTITVNDDSHNHVIANVDGLQSALDGKSATSHNHDSAYISKSLQMTADNGDVYVSWTDKDVVAQIKALSIGMYTAYAKSGTTNNPKTTEAWRFMVHKTSATYGWTMAFGSYGSVYSGYVDNGNWKGWRCIYDVSPAPLWTGAMYMSSSNGTPQVVTPSKKLSECQHGWLLLWSDYDPGDGANDADFVTTMIPKRNATGGTWGGKSFLCDIPRYVGSDATDTSTEKRIIKPIYVHDDCIKGSYQNASGDRNDVVLRAVYEY